MNIRLIAQAACGNYIVMMGGTVAGFYFLARPTLHLVAAFLGALSNFGSGY